MRLTPKAYEIGLADEERYEVMCRKRRCRDALIEFARTESVSPSMVEAYLASVGSSPMKQGCKLADLLARPGVTVGGMAEVLPSLRGELDKLPSELRDEIIEAVEILIKYRGYIERERLIADKLRRLEDVRISPSFDFAGVKALSTEARQKLERIRPSTIGQASRIPGISPSDVNILLLLMNR